MSVFMKDGKIKSNVLLYGFFLSLLYFCIYPLVFLLCTDLLAKMGIPEAGGLFFVLGPGAAISLLVSILLCIPMYIKKESPIIMVAFTLQVLYALILFFMVLIMYKDDERRMLFEVLKFYSVIPAVCGNVVAWGYYGIRKLILKKSA